MPNAGANGKSAMPAAASTNPASTSGSRPRPRARGAVRGRAGPRHQQEQQHVVDRHHRADGGAVIAERVAHERRHEGAEQRSGDAGEESAQSDDQAGEIGRRAG